MAIFIEGIQNSGKTTLMKASNYVYNRFPFDKYVRDYDLQDKKSLNGFQLGKDLGILFGLQYTSQNMLFDRGPLSTIYYSLLMHRWKKDSPYLNNFLKELSKYEHVYVFVDRINCQNKISRNRKDGFDELSKRENQEKEKREVFDLFKKHRLPIFLFNNDFSKPIEENVEKFNSLIRKIKNEHDRN